MAVHDIRRRRLGWLFLRVLCFAAAVPLLMRLRLPVLDRWLEGRIGSARARGWDRTAPDDALQCLEAARLLGWPLVRPGCLTRGLTLYYFLRRAGMDITLCFGARVRDGELTQEVGHCWLEQGGKPMLERLDPYASFVTIYSLPARERASGQRCGERV
jgi:hypothetical protein